VLVGSVPVNLTPAGSLRSSSSPVLSVNIIASTVVRPRRTCKEAPERFTYDYISTLEPKTQEQERTSFRQLDDVFGTLSSMKSPVGGWPTIAAAG